VFTGAEAAAASSVSFLATAIIAAYIGDAIGLSLHPTVILLLSAAAAGAVAVRLRPRATGARGDLPAAAGIVGAVLSWLVWLAWPHMLPTGSGSDLTHHLQLIEYIDRTGHLVHDRTLSAYLGEMIDYTPGSHLVAVLVGRWLRTDGLHAGYPTVALSIALKAGIAFLIALRILPRGTTRRPLALFAVLLLFVPRAYFAGSFTQHWFFAQVVAELFAVTMWWAIVAWDQDATAGAAAMCGLAGAALFLTWPVWLGPALMTLAAIALLGRDVPMSVRARHMALAGVPIAAVAAIHMSGRIGAAAIAGTSGFVISPTAATMGWPLLVAGAVGTVRTALDRRSRAVAIFAGAIVLQAAALAAVAARAQSDTPYLALKMFYLMIYPLAVAGAAAVSLAVGRTARHGSVLAWTITVALGALVARDLALAPRPRPVISDSLRDAGRWTLAHVPPQCVDYLVADDDSAYWLHLAVLGNPRASPRSLDSDTFEPRLALIRWVLAGGLPYAIVEDFDALPRDIRTNVDVLARFERAAVVKRRGASSCSQRPS